VTEEETQTALRLQTIFMPYSIRQRMEACERQGVDHMGPDGLKFAHYTSVEAALNILRTKRLWLRNATCMSDRSEVQHGFNMLQRYFDEARTKEFADAIDTISPGAAMEAITTFNGWWTNRLALNIYVGSVSEHDARDEDQHGRLSMWRAFGSSSTTRVALVIRVPNHSQGAVALSIMFSPVAYLAEPVVHQQVRDVMENVKRESDFLKSVDRQTLVNHLFLMLFAGVTCLKHEGFHEEREWRVVYNPEIFPSRLMQRSLETIAGVPQHIFQVPMDQTFSSEVSDLDVSRLIDRVIIGPSPYPWVLYQAFVEVLKAADVQNPEARVWVSGIPIRY
jgi:hypothetical protein